MKGEALLVAGVGVLAFIAVAWLLVLSARRRKWRNIVSAGIALAIGTTILGSFTGSPWLDPAEQEAINKIAADGGSFGVPAVTWMRFHRPIWHVHFVEKRPKNETFRCLSDLPDLQSVQVGRGLFSDDELATIREMLPDDVSLQTVASDR